MLVYYLLAMVDGGCGSFFKGRKGGKGRQHSKNIQKSVSLFASISLVNFLNKNVQIIASKTYLPPFQLLQICFEMNIAFLKSR